jgi:hypothetical protein
MPTAALPGTAHELGSADPSPHPAPAAASSALPPPPAIRAQDLSIALLGLLALGGAAALGMSSADPRGLSSLRLLPSVVLVALPALASTAPALIATHQFLRLAASPEALAAALGRAWIHAGRIAGALALVVLVFAATTRLAAPLLVASLAAVGVFMSATASVELQAAEARASERVAPEFDRATPSPAFTLLVLGWLVLSWLVALRVGVDVAGWVIGSGGGR